jgi:hypothetical protein
VENPVELIGEYIKHREVREQQILAVLQRTHQSLSVQDLVKEVYPDITPHLVVAAGNSLNHHLQKLQKEGRVSVLPTACFSRVRSPLTFGCCASGPRVRRLRGYCTVEGSLVIEVLLDLYSAG